ncbi:MAG: hypothetical protein GY862_31880 [Gammaproteobacteria bacterium]|nr:hypothetical protein [Gammaproteobacteria bacterium]
MMVIQFQGDIDNLSLHAQASWLAITDGLGGLLTTLNEFPAELGLIAKNLEIADFAIVQFYDSMYQGRTYVQIFRDAWTEIMNLPTALKALSAIGVAEFERMKGGFSGLWIDGKIIALLAFQSIDDRLLRTRTNIADVGETFGNWWVGGKIMAAQAFGAISGWFGDARWGVVFDAFNLGFDAKGWDFVGGDVADVLAAEIQSAQAFLDASTPINEQAQVFVSDFVQKTFGGTEDIGAQVEAELNDFISNPRVPLNLRYCASSQYISI